jgi:VanZ family protein
MKRSNILFVLVMVATAVGFIRREDYTYIYNILVLGAVYFSIPYMEFKLNFRIKNYIKILLIITFILHSSFGQYINLYQKNNWFDKGLHLFGTFAFSLLLYAIMTALIDVNTNSKIYAFIVISSIGITVGVFFELLEFTLDIATGSKHQHGLNDTNLDIIFNMIGAYLSGVWVTYNRNSLLNRMQQ